MPPLTNVIKAIVAIFAVALTIVAARWPSASAQGEGLFRVGTCWRALGAQSLAGPQFKVLEVAGPWLRTTEATGSIGSTWINTQQLPGARL